MNWREIASEPPPRDGSWIVVTSTHNPYARAAIQWLYESWRDMREADLTPFMEDGFTHWAPSPLLGSEG